MIHVLVDSWIAPVVSKCAYRCFTLSKKQGLISSEQEEMMRKSGIDLTPDMWLVSPALDSIMEATATDSQVKLLMGPIDTSYDTKGKCIS